MEILDDPVERTWRRSGDAGPSRGRVGWPAVVAFAVVAAFASLAVSHLIFPHFSMNNDEPVYVFQARMLLDHHVTLPVTSETAFFRPWMSGVVDDHLVMVFPPVLPALLALGQLLFGSMTTVLAVTAGAGVLLVAALASAVTGERRTTVIAAGLLAICPLYVIQSGMFLSYVLALDLELAAALLLVLGARDRRLRWFLGAGAALGVLFFARPFDALLTGVPLLATGLVLGTTGHTERLRRAAATAVGAAPFGLTSLTYNFAVTGSPFRLPLAAIGGNNAAGFGIRQLSAGTPLVHYGWQQAVTATGKNLGALAGWIPGGVLLIGLAGFGLYRQRRNPWAWSLAAFAVTIPCGYLFYWGNLLVVGGRRTIGPHYYLALLAPLTVLGAVGIGALSRRWRSAGAVLCVLVLVMAAASLEPRIRLDHRQAALHAREQALVEGADLHNALVFLPSEAPDGPWLLHPRPSFMNDPRLRQSVLFATDHAGANFDLVDRFATRHLYREASRVPPGEGNRQPVPTLWRLHPQSAAGYRFRVHLVNAAGQPVVTAYLSDGARLYRYCLDRSSERGRSYDVDWTVSPEGVTFHATGTPAGDSDPQGDRTSGPVPTGTLAVGAEFGPSPLRASSSLVEERYWLRSRADGVDLMLPGEQWQYRPLPKPTWVDQDATSGFAVMTQAI